MQWRLKHRERVLLRCTLMLRPACGRFISILRQRRRLQALQLLATAPCSLPYDVGYNVETESFTFRDVYTVWLEAARAPPVNYFFQRTTAVHMSEG